MACDCSCDRPKFAHQAVARLGVVLDAADERDDLVEVIERDAEALEDVRARLGLPQLELGPPPDHLAAELDELLDELEQVQDAAAGRATMASMMTPKLVCSGVCL